MDTNFASAQQSSPQEIERAKQTIVSSESFKKALNFFPEMVLILDKTRQTVYANQELLRTFDLKTLPDALGKRPGDIFRCIHARDEAGGTARDPAIDATIDRKRFELRSRVNAGRAPIERLQPPEFRLQPGLQPRPPELLPAAHQHPQPAVPGAAAGDGQEALDLSA